MIGWVRRLDWPGRLVLIGVVLTLGSALISQSLIAQIEEEALALSRQEASLDRQIREQWDVLSRAESRIYFGELLEKPAGAADLKAIELALLHTRSRMTEHIDELYIKQLDVSQQRMRHESEARRYQNLAFVLQMIGLILVVARDLARRE